MLMSSFYIKRGEVSASMIQLAVGQITFNDGRLNAQNAHQQS
jgi:hypothetical protein